MSLLLVFLPFGCVSHSTPTSYGKFGEAWDTGTLETGMDEMLPSTGLDLRIPSLCYPHPADPADEMRCQFLMKDILAGEYGDEIRLEAIRVVRAHP